MSLKTSNLTYTFDSITVSYSNHYHSRKHCAVDIASDKCPTGRKFSLEFKFLYSLIENSPNLTSAYLLHF